MNIDDPDDFHNLLGQNRVGLAVALIGSGTGWARVEHGLGTGRGIAIKVTDCNFVAAGLQNGYAFFPTAQIPKIMPK